MISGATNIKADDVITISLTKMTLTGPAEDDNESMRLQVGANAGQEMDLSIASMKAKDLGIVKTSTTVDIDGTGTNVGKALDVTSQAKASLAIEAYDGAIQKVSTQRAKLGAIQNRLEHTINNLDTSAENLQAAESAIRDVDMAEEMTNYSKNNILMQAGQSMLAQANQSNQGVLSILG
jgi:flagellin